jgi:hypothetical protein
MGQLAMQSNLEPRAALQSSVSSPSTRRLLVGGVLAGPLYLVVGLAQAVLRDGFDLMRHPLSVLANGPSGWVQTANFVISGLLVVGAAVAISRAVRPRPVALSMFVAAFGAGMLVAAIFPADPVDGFPPGTPEGPPTSITTAGLIHFAAAALAFVSLGISCFLGARAMARLNARALMRLSLLSGLAVLLGFFGGIFSGVAAGVLGIWFSVVVGWAWLSIVSLHLYRQVGRS